MVPVFVLKAKTLKIDLLCGILARPLPLYLPMDKHLSPVKTCNPAFYHHLRLCSIAVRFCFCVKRIPVTNLILSSVGTQCYKKESIRGHRGQWTNFNLCFVSRQSQHNKLAE